DCIELSEEESILSDVLTRKQSDTNNKVAIVEEAEEKKQDGSEQSKLIENSKLSDQESEVAKAKLSTAKKPEVNKAFELQQASDRIMTASIFDVNSKVTRQAPELPSIDGIEYPRAASWASESLNNVLKDEKGRQLFRVFLHDSLAEENLSFIESFEKFKRMTSAIEKKRYIQEFFDKYSPYVNLSSVALQKIKTAATQDDPDPSAFLLAIKEVNRMLENDQFPRFKRSDIYINFLEKVMPRAYADKWATSFEALVGNQAIFSILFFSTFFF
ncbi:unnamed protein product, partial [Onchocerca flexuosa]|uniref:RGS domain-containing protein n=1 Tax=Onchocerca flexuosa TaxID=387005 RepID=A0A183HGK5_9BILA